MESPTGESPKEPRTFWLQEKPALRPASTSINPDFLKILNSSPHSWILDVGCGLGRITSVIPLKHKVIGVDPNEVEVNEANRQKYLNAKFMVGLGESLPFKDTSFDVALFLGTLSAINKTNREKVLKETMRCLKKGALVYVADFSFIDDQDEYTSNGKRWQDVYDNDQKTTGEHGTFIVTNPDGSPMFYAHHFKEKEIKDLLEVNGIKISELRKIQVISKVSGQARYTWNIWGVKQ
jgi:ubiquinone/menaquinone biosynthesis C-methylase UbiE